MVNPSPQRSLISVSFQLLYKFELCQLDSLSQYVSISFIQGLIQYLSVFLLVNSIGASFYSGTFYFFLGIISLNDAAQEINIDHVMQANTEVLTFVVLM